MNYRLLIAFFALCFAAAPSIHAAAIIAFSQNGSNVVATGSGSFSLLSLASDVSSNGGPVLRPSQGLLRIGASMYTRYIFLAGPTSFGSGNFTGASSSTGDNFGVSSGTSLLVPSGYVFGTALSGSATWTNTTIAGLGLTPGSYLYTWGNSDVNDSLTINIPAAVPEPQSLALISGGVLVMLALRKRIASRLH